MAVYEALSEEEAYLWALLSDESGLDQAEFAFTDDTQDDGCFRAWPFQWGWWRCEDQLQIDRGSRSCGKSLSIKFRAFAFPFVNPGEEMVITAPEGVHLDAVTDNVETLFLNTRLAREMIAKGRGGIKHRPFMINFANGGRIMGRIPQRDGKGVKGIHPIWLETDEACLPAGTLILTKEGHKPIETIGPNDLVMTHKGRWKRVLNVFDNGVRDTLKVEVQGHPEGLVITPNHRFWGKRITDYKDRKNKWRPITDSFDWIRADEIAEAQVSSPVQAPYVEPPEIIPKARTGASEEIKILSDDFLWCLGLYIAEGSTSSGYGKGGIPTKATWSVHVNEVDYVIERLRGAGLKPFVQLVQNTQNAMNVVVAGVELCKFLNNEIGKGCHNKRIPTWVHSLEDGQRRLVLDGLIYGDGMTCKDPQYSGGRWRISTTSRSLVFDVRLLSQSLGLSFAAHYRKAGAVNKIRGKKFISGPSYDLVISEKGFPKVEQQLVLRKPRSVSKNKPVRVYDLEVEDDHSFVADGIVVHNSDWPEVAWAEIIETVKIQNPKARWRCHGVTRGVGGGFDERCQPDSGWKVHALPAMLRPNWTEEERQSKIKEYGGSVDAVDYRRNVLGLPGDQNSPIFVLYRLMQACDVDVNSHYNENEYVSLEIDESMVREVGNIEQLLDFPGSHRSYKRFWVGMDVGWCVDTETEILTKRGWLKYDQVLIGDESLAIDPATGLSDWQTITDLYIETGVFDMVHMKGQSFDAMTTPHHRWLVKDDNNNWRWKTTETLNTKDRIPLNVPRASSVAGIHKDELVELVAWIFCEGSIKPSGAVQLSQSHIVNPDHTERIQSILGILLGEQGWHRDGHDWRSYTKFNNDDGLTHHGSEVTYFEISKRGMEKLELLNVFGVDKEISPRFLTQLSNEQLEIFIDTCNKGDGWTAKNGSLCFEQNSVKRSDSYQMACAISGKSISTSHNSDRDRWHSKLIKSSTVGPVKAAQFPCSTKQAMTITTDRKLRTIWCPTIKHRNWLARRNGSVYFTGNTIAPSSIVIFAEEPPATKTGKTRLKLIARILLKKVSTPDQARAIIHILDVYRPQVFALDSTGAGFPLFEYVQQLAREMPDLKKLVPRIVGYNFSEKIIAEFDDNIEIDELAPDGYQDAAIKRNVLEWSTDILRGMVDEKTILLPYDKSIIGEFQGQTWTYSKSALDPYGRKKLYSSGSFHTLDACRMAVLAYQQSVINEFIKSKTNSWEPPPMLFL